MIFFNLILLCCFFSCNNSASNKSYITLLDEIDSNISLGQTRVALDLLKKLEKTNKSAEVKLSVYKRYKILGETKLQEKLITKALKKYPKDIRFLAIKSNELLKNQKYKEAQEYSQKLTGTKYSSLYAQNLLQLDFAKSQDQIEYEKYMSNDYLTIFYDAYYGTKNNDFLKNCALINLINSKIDLAYEYLPQEFSDYKDAYFWGLVSFDAKQFVDAVECFSTSENLLQNRDMYLNTNLAKKNIDIDFYKVTISALLQDCYIQLNENALADKERSNMLSYISSLGDDELGSEVGSELDGKVIGKLDDAQQFQMLSVIYLNSALYSLSKNDIKSAYKLLTFVIQTWPNFVPGLIAYANFVYDYSKFVQNDPMTQELKALGIKSIDMEHFDEFPIIPVTDPIYKMQEALKVNNDQKLFVAKLSLEDKISTATEKQRVAKIYQILERNTLEPNIYPSLITEYAIHTLFTLDKSQEAISIFKNYIASKYKFDKNKFYDNVFKNIHSLESWELENTAYIALLENNAKVTKNLYEFLCYKEHLKSDTYTKEISSRASTSALLNLALIYACTNKTSESIELYSFAINNSKDIFLKSETLYRLALVYNKLDNKPEAIKTLKYALYLNPSHTNARLVLSKIL